MVLNNNLYQYLLKAFKQSSILYSRSKIWPNHEISDGCGYVDMWMDGCGYYVVDMDMLMWIYDMDVLILILILILILVIVILVHFIEGVHPSSSYLGQRIIDW